MPNVFAYLILAVWPLVTVAIFQRLSVPKAAAVSIVAGYLLLPGVVLFDLPLIPAWNKTLAAVLPALIMAAVKSRPATVHLRGAAPAEDLHVMPGWVPRGTFVRLCLIGIVAGPFFTSITNLDTLHYGAFTALPLGFREAGSSVLEALIMVLPFLIARKFLAHPREQVTLLAILSLAGLAYSLPALYEIRMSPQLSNMIYGYFPHSWIQHIRDGGFRPLVFLEHGLRLAIFLAAAFLATLGWMKSAAQGHRPQFVVAAIWLLGTLVLCKSLTGLVVAVLFAPVILFLGNRTQILVASIVALTVLTYPMMRNAGLVPIGHIVSALSIVAEPDRIRSLDFRLRSEDLLIEKANDRALFGWGRFGRNLVYNENGGSIATAEGSWIILFGQYGWVGYLSHFGLLAIPVVLLTFRRRGDLTVASSALSVALVGNLVDLIPNSGLTSVTWLMAGAVAGRLELGRIDKSTPQAEAELPRQTSPYRRAFPTGSASAEDGPVLRRPLDRNARPRRSRS